MATLTADQIFPGTLVPMEAYLKRELKPILGDLSEVLSSDLKDLFAEKKGADLHGAIYRRLEHASEEIVADYIRAKHASDRRPGYDVETVNENALIGLKEFFREWCTDFFRAQGQTDAEVLLSTHVGTSEQSLRYDDLFREAAEKAAGNTRFTEGINRAVRDDS